MKLKKNVRLTGIRPELMIAIIVANDVYDTYNKELVLTSVLDGTHSNLSLHYAGCAFDCRTRYFDYSTVRDVAKDIRSKLTKDFDVVIEPSHLHIEFQPRK